MKIDPSMHNSVEPAIDPQNKIVFLLDWEITVKCNYDCSYCNPRNHDNSRPHPPLDECLKTIEFMFEYADLYSNVRSKPFRDVILNVYGGEALAHPNIVEILQHVRKVYNEKKYKWNLIVNNTTNASLSANAMDKVIPLIDKFTISYHTEALPKQKAQVRKNIEKVFDSGKLNKVIVLMHEKDEYFAESAELHQWCKENNIPSLPKQLDGSISNNYSASQSKWLSNTYKTDKSVKSDTEYEEEIARLHNQKTMSKMGRRCCGGRTLSLNENFSQRESFVFNNNFQGWSCSVNYFFLYISQADRTIFTNKDCRMNFNGSVGPIGTLDNTQELIKFTKQHLENSTLPVIVCKKTQCLCGLCAPKAKTSATYNKIMKKYLNSSQSKFC